MFVIANVLGSSIQISTLPLPVLSTLQASGLVFNSICATLILGEPFTRWSVWGTLLVCAGAVLIATFGAIPSPAHKLSELLELLGRKPFLIWMSFQAVITVGLALATDIVSYFTTLMQDHRFRLARGFLYGFISGTLSAHSLLLAKSAVELLMRTIVDKDNQFVHWQAWMIVVGLVILALTQLYYLHRGLKLVSTSVLYPFIFCIYNIVAILDGLIYFRQTDLINPLRACLITLGTAILLSGVLSLSWRLTDEQHPPAVGQSTLAPGLGLVEDTEGEEDLEEELSLHSALLGDEERGNLETVPSSSYQTFRSPPAPSPGISTQPTTPGTRSQTLMSRPRLHSTPPRWQDTGIWGELDDRSTIAPQSPAVSKRRLASMPIRTNRFGEETEPLLGGTRISLGGGRRRVSTGFPGFTARKRTLSTGTGRRTASASGRWGLWNWWRRKQSRPIPVSPEYRDDADLEDGRRSGTRSGMGLGLGIHGAHEKSLV